MVAETKRAKTTLARVAFSCHVALDMLCQKMQERCSKLEQFRFCGTRCALLRNEGVPSVRLCASLFCVLFRRSEGGVAAYRKFFGAAVERKSSPTFAVSGSEG